MSSTMNESVAPLSGYANSAFAPGVPAQAARPKAGSVQGSAGAGPSPGNQRSLKEETVRETPSREAVEKAIIQAREFAQNLSRKLSFSYDDRIEKVIVRVMEGTSDKVIRQIPPEEMIRLSLKMDELMGMLINQDA